MTLIIPFHFFFGRHYWAARAVKFSRGTSGLLEPVPYILEAPTLQLVIPLFSEANTYSMTIITS